MNFERLSEKAAISQIKSNQIKYALTIKISNGGEVSGELYSNSNTDPKLESGLQTILNNIQAQQVIGNSNLEEQQIKLLSSNANLERNYLTETSKTALSLKEENFSFFFAYILMIAMVFIIINYTNQTAMEIASEKTSRVIEMVITSIAPSHHIIAKITAILAVAMTQIVLVSLTFYIGFITSDSSNIFEALNIEITSNNKDIIYYGIIFWVLGVFSYTVLSSILGSLTSVTDKLKWTVSAK